MHFSIKIQYLIIRKKYFYAKLLEYIYELGNKKLVNENFNPLFFSIFVDIYFRNCENKLIKAIEMNVK